VNKIIFQPLFFVGLAVRLAMIMVVAPVASTEWYVPFLEFSIPLVSFDPWSKWLEGGGVLAAFPYGYVMWLVFLPLSLAAKSLGFDPLYGYALTLLAADFSMLIVLQSLLPGRRQLLLSAYWLSPIVILASYALGLNDLIPTLLLTFSMLFIRRVDLRLSGAFCASAISAKLSMIIAFPLFLIYLYNNKPLRQTMVDFLFGFVATAGLFGVPFFFSNAGLQMLFGNPEMGKIYRVALNIGDNVSIYVIPLLYLVMLYLLWRIRRLNFDLFQVTTGMIFLLVVLMTPATPGWFVWSLPFLVLYQAVSGKVAITFVVGFSVLYALSVLLVTPILFSNGRSFELFNVLQLSPQLEGHATSLVHTAMVAIGVVLAVRIWRETISRNDFFRLSRRPFVIGVAGDSGAGKDTFADAITGLFGVHSVVKLSGDDYHLWDRQKPMWQVMTHLNPMANDLERFCNDLVSLIDGRTIQLRHYDHQTGKMSKPFLIGSNDFIIASGLHALYLPIIRDCYNLKIYLDIDEDLRRYFKLKRDVQQRGHAVDRVISSFLKRKSDSDNFIRPQSAFADLTLALQPIHPRLLESLDHKQALRLKLVVRTKRGFNELSLNRILVGVCGLHVDIVLNEDSTQIQMTIEGESSSEDIQLAATMLCPRALEFLDIRPKWQDGMLGLMQLITLSHINQALTKRFL